MKKIVLLCAMLLVMHEMNPKFFLRSSHQVFYDMLTDAASHSDAKAIYLFMLGSSKFQKICLDELHAQKSKILQVKVITDCPFEPWTYPYFSQASIIAEQKMFQSNRSWSALIMGCNHEPRIAFTTKLSLFKNNFELYDKAQHLQAIKEEFEKEWQDLQGFR